ncbi:hypothetical protein L1987_55040 [Smallanthus sonchifolius]|uniref:Uncharacterized protein n=1 Tax=Smallanthus sonchifolius TaxID=185202 RepID=A0ACB9E8F8_9ASTR|nr:hypothetical protein L1987_55040 [Smallanthus sonchifolius]
MHIRARMERTEPTLVPEWLKNSVSLTTASHQSSLHSDDKSASKSLRNKSLDSDLGRATTSSYFRRASSSNGSTHSRSFRSFGRTHDRYRDKHKLKTENWNRDYSDSLANILPRWFDKDGVRRSHSNVFAKHVESWPRKFAAEKGDNNGKIPFERDFPSLGAGEKQVDSEVGRVPSPALSSVIQSLSVGNSGVIGGDVWTSVLAEVPVMVGTSGSTSISVTANVATGRNMAETLAQGYTRAQTTPQLSVGTQRLEELAVKQSRQLIPMTLSMPKALALNSYDRPKIKVGGQLQLQNSHILSPRPVSVNADVTKTSSPSSSNVGKLHVLKPSRERNCTTPIKETSSPTCRSKLPNSPLVVPLDRKPSVSFTLEKRPSPQAKSRNDFFNLMRKKSMANNSPSPVSPDTRSTESANDTPCERGTQGYGGVRSFDENKVVLYSEEEEARFLKSLGWEETTEEEGLTEEEINSFYRDVSKYVNLKTASSFLKGTQPKCLMPLTDGEKW